MLHADQGDLHWGHPKGLSQEDALSDDRKVQDCYARMEYGEQPPYSLTWPLSICSSQIRAQPAFPTPAWRRPGIKKNSLNT